MLALLAFPEISVSMSVTAAYMQLRAITPHPEASMKLYSDRSLSHGWRVG